MMDTTRCSDAEPASPTAPSVAKRVESAEAKYNRLNKRIVRQLPVTAAETAFVWREKSRRMLKESNAQ